MLNRAVVVGRLTRDVDLRYTPNGVAVANFTVAANRPFKSQQGEQEADFINCVAWRNQAENLANYMKKGSLIGVDGRIQTRTYDDKDGKRVFITEILTESIQFLEPRNEQENKKVEPSQVNAKAEKNTFEQSEQLAEIDEDDLPF